MKTGFVPAMHYAIGRWAARGWAAAIRGWHWTRSKAMTPMPIDRLGAYIVAIFLLCGLCLLQDFPLRLPGLAIGLLGAGAVVVAVRADHLTKWEKLGWICVAFLLFIVEARALYKDRAEQDAIFLATRQAEERRFNQIANGVDTTIINARNQFEAAMRRANAVLGLSRESLDNITGGDSYAYIAAFISPQGPPFQLSVWVRGKHMVHNVTAEIQTILGGTDMETLGRQIQSIHALALGNGDFIPGITVINDSVGSGKYVITIRSRNQWSTEQLGIVQCSDGQWSEAINLSGVGQKENDKLKGRPGCNLPVSP